MPGGSQADDCDLVVGRKCRMGSMHKEDRKSDGEAEEPSMVFEMGHITREENIESGIKIWIIPRMQH